MWKNLLTFFACCIAWSTLQAQIINGTDTLYGNEWINFNQSYFKIMVAEDGIYRLTGQVMTDAGIPLSQASGSQLQLFHNGEEVPLHVTTNGTFAPNDYLEFFGKKNTSELDRHLFKDPDAEMMNPLYSLFTDTSAYFLTWSVTASPLRYQAIPNNLTNLPAKEPYYMAQHTLNYFSAFSKKANSQGISSSDYGLTEGYSNAFANVQTITVTAPNPFPGGPDGSLYLRYGSNIGQHQQLITLNDQPLLTDEFSDFQVRQHTFAVPNATLQSAMSLKFQGLAANTDRQRIANVILTYPAQWKANNQPAFSFEMPASPIVRYLEIENFNAANGTPVLYDLTNRTRLSAIFENNVVKIALPPSATAVQLVLVNDATGVKIPPPPTSVQFIDYQNLNAQFILLSNPRLYDDGNGNNFVQQYADYRSSAAGGGYSTVIVDVQQLYEQFGWGLNRHPLSIRNFAHFVKKHWPDVQYFFVVGKGREYTAVRTQAQLSNSGNASYYVPTFGVPGADNLLVSVGGTATPMVPFGRLAVDMPLQIKNYLNKIIQAESNKYLPQTIEDRAWMKQVMHLGGGDINIQNLIKNYLLGMENELVSNKFGAKVFSFYKTSSDPIQISRSEEILQLIKSGLSIITFFGHSGQNSFDFSLDSPENYENKGKYPLFFSLGCYSGNIHQGQMGVSERFVFEEEKGAIAFMASSGQGYVSALNQLCWEYYHQLGTEEYGQGIGKVLQKSINVLESQGLGSARELVQQFTLNGDPSFILNAFEGPDITVNSSTVLFDPDKINVELDSFVFSFAVQNIGLHQKDSFVLEIRRELPSGINVSVLRDTVQAPAFDKVFQYKIPTMGQEATGLNRFFVILDADQSIEELPVPMAEMNNELIAANGALGITNFFFSNDIRPQYPKEFAIVAQTPITLKASTSNTFAGLRKYVIQLDTTALFNSFFLKESKKEMVGGVLSWSPEANYENGKVYYWRVSPDSIDAAGYSWRNSSFIYLQDEPSGWNQSHFYQFRKNQFEDLELSEGRRWKFLDDYKDIVITQGVFPIIRPQISVNNNPFLYIPWDGPIKGGLMIMVLDSITVNPWFNIPTGPGSNVGQYGSNIPSWTGGGYAAFPYTTRTAAGRKLAINFLDSIIPANNYVVIITAHEQGFDYKPEDWEADSLTNNGKNLFNILEQQGANLIRSTATDGAVPYYFVYKKNDPSFVPIEGKTDPASITTKAVGLLGRWDNGFTETRNIGPASSWGSVNWGVEEWDITSDSISLDVIGVKNDSITEILMTGLKDFTIPLSNINAAEFPYLRLRFFASDTLLLNPPQLSFWRVYYTGMPELSLNPSAHFYLYNDTLQQGEILKMEVAVENIGDIGVDTLFMKYRIADEKNAEAVFHSLEKPLPPGDITVAMVNIPTKDLGGKYQLFIEANPQNEPKEENRLNNIGVTNFYIQQDKRNPLMDVYFDGTQILDGDLVSSRPNIRVDLRDENKFIALNDTSLFNLFFQYPDEPEFRRISFSQPGVVFYPANLSEGKNKAIVEVSAAFEKDGIYQLIVQAKDATGNSSGTYNYKVSFRVITKPSISNILNYPNPFSTSTRFLYTLTGHEPPAKYKLQIMTVSGRVVREITQDEMGILKPGTHLTDYIWDGCDEYGDKLAIGVYVYRFLAQNQDGSDWGKYDNGTDTYFKSGFGKMVIVR